MEKNKAQPVTLWPWWDKTHRANKHASLRGSYLKKERIINKKGTGPANTCQTHAATTKKVPIIWKNTRRDWVRFGLGGAKRTLPRNTCHTAATTTKRGQSYGKM